MVIPVEAILANARDHLRQTGRPFVTLSFAQSLDGSLTAEKGTPMAISGEESLVMTHQMRATHAAILVGIGTVLADNPRLTARKFPGPDPQRIILDTNLRTPVEAQIVQTLPASWIFCARNSSPEKIRALRALGVEIFTVPRLDDNCLDLAAMLAVLGEKGLDSLMVEGGAAVIKNFFNSGLVDLVVLTLAPIFVGGPKSVEDRLDSMPRLADPSYIQLGDDLVVVGRVEK